MGGVGTVLQGPVGDIDGGAPGRFVLRPPPGSRCRMLVLRHLRLPCRPHREGIVIAGIDGLGIRETGPCVAPVALFMVFSPGTGRLASGEHRVVVADDLLALGVALARRQHIGAGILQHRDEEGQDVALRVHVLHRAVDRGALPFPAVGLLLEIPTVALPQGDMPPGHSLCKCLSAKFFHHRIAFPVLDAEIVRDRFPVLGQDRRHEFVQHDALAENLPVFLLPPGGRREGFQLLPEPVDILLVPGIVAQFLREIDIDEIPPPHDLVQPQGRLDTRPFLEPDAEAVRDGPEVAVDALGLHPGGGQAGEKKQDGEPFRHVSAV